jgi:hypothetical protein
VVRFVENSLPFNRLNISRADISCVLENDVGKAARSTRPVTLYITANITPPNSYNSPPSIQTEDHDSPAEEAIVQGRIQFPAVPEHLSHHQPADTGPITSMPQSPEEMSPTGTENPRPALDRADQVMKQIDRSTSWERAVGRIKWVMDTLGPIAEVRTIPF